MKYKKWDAFSGWVETPYILQCMSLLPICMSLRSRHQNTKQFLKERKNRVMAKSSSVPLSRVQFIVIAYAVMTPIIHWRRRCKGQMQQTEIGFWKTQTRWEYSNQKQTTSPVLLFCPLWILFCDNRNSLWPRTFLHIFLVFYSVQILFKRTKIHRSLTAVLISKEETMYYFIDFTLIVSFDWWCILSVCTYEECYILMEKT